MYITQFFTEQDTSLSQSLNIDPLGMTMIWSTLGQKLFHNRVSSISNDVRNYTLNLLHHYVIKTAIERELEISKALSAEVERLDSYAFKQSCLIHFENLFVYSMLEASETVDTKGVLGASKARIQLNANESPRLFFTNAQKGQLLIRQLTLGVSGRYKTPFTEMGLFDKEYRYHLPEYETQWQQTQDFIKNNHKLNALAEHLIVHLSALISQPNKQPEITWLAVDKSIVSGYAECFATAQVVGQQSKQFWLTMSRLDQNAAGSIYQVLNNQLQIVHPQQIIESAILSQSDEHEKKNLTDICFVEPLLAECDLLFTLLMSERDQSFEQAYQTYRLLGRDVDSIVSIARQLSDQPAVTMVFKGMAYQRYQQLLTLGGLDASSTLKSFTALVESLLKYHQSIMNSRGQSAWVDVTSEQTYRCNVKLKKIPAAEERPYKQWFNRYYMDEFNNLISGLEGTMNMKFPSDTKEVGDA